MVCSFFQLMRSQWGQDEQLICYRGFKALKQMTKMNYLYRHQPDEALKTYRELLGYTKVGPFLLTYWLNQLS
jgi:hypothetical protein